MTTRKKLPVLFFREDNCPNCEWDSIELFDYFNTPLGYKYLVDRKRRGEEINIFDRKTVYRARCKRCGKTYDIMWKNGFPVPVKFDHFKIENFLHKYYSDR